MLNEFQKNAFAGILRTIEEMLQEMACKMEHVSHQGILYEHCIDEALLKNQDDFFHKKARVGEILQNLQQQFGLERRIIDVKRNMSGGLHYCLQILDDARAGKLKGFGTVTEGVDELIDPQTDQIKQCLQEMIALINS